MKKKKITNFFEKIINLFKLKKKILLDEFEYTFIKEKNYLELIKNMIKRNLKDLNILKENLFKNQLNFELIKKKINYYKEIALTCKFKELDLFPNINNEEFCQDINHLYEQLFSVHITNINEKKNFEQKSESLILAELYKNDKNNENSTDINYKKNQNNNIVNLSEKNITNKFSKKNLYKINSVKNFKKFNFQKNNFNENFEIKEVLNYLQNTEEISDLEIESLNNNLIKKSEFAKSIDLKSFDSLSNINSLIIETKINDLPNGFENILGNQEKIKK